MTKDNINTYESLDALSDKGKRLEDLITRSKNIWEKKRRVPITFNDWLYQASMEPELAFRDIFQLFSDMIRHYVPEGEDDYIPSNDSVGFIKYDMSDLFIDQCENPFFADRLFAFRFMKLIEGLKQRSQQNHIYLFEGPPGSGKSTFLTNLLLKLEEYSLLPEGAMYEVYWSLEIDKVGGLKKIHNGLHKIAVETRSDSLHKQIESPLFNPLFPKKYLDIISPHHDHPILMLPKGLRKNFLDELIPDSKFKNKLFTNKEYEWVFKDIPSNISSSIFTSLLDDLGDPLEVFHMIKVRRVLFSRQLGEGISVYNPSDSVNTKPISNQGFQDLINDLLKRDNITYMYSSLAKTNNGILALMDIKENNVERLKNLHGIISDGVHKVNFIEEKIKSIFFGLVNPEDKVHYENVKSFQDRIITMNIPYVLDYKTEVAIYRNKMNNDIDKCFLPRVLNNFARIIIASRMENNTPGISKWISDKNKYNKYIDRDLLLLKMEIYTGNVPDWIEDEDIKRFDKNIRKSILSDTELEGLKGFSGRQAINIFNLFFNKYYKKEALITMDQLTRFFKHDIGKLRDMIPPDFIDSLVILYDYNVLQEVKEAAYYYNEDQISKDIRNYLFAINYEIGEKRKSVYTNQMIDISEEYLNNFEMRILGTSASVGDKLEFRKETHREYVTRSLAHEIKVLKKKITETELFRKLFERYTRNLKSNALAPYTENDNFRRALSDHGSKGFDKYDDRIKRDINHLIQNLQNKFGYCATGAKQVSMYVLERKLVDKY
jgi:predicted Ser/Thr protein kinase